MKKTFILNSAKFNYDKQLDFSKLKQISDVTEYDSIQLSDIPFKTEGYDILVTKELPFPGDLIKNLPSSVKLICEAGTGYNNIDTKAARERDMLVCNVPGYSTEAVAQLAISAILNLSSSITWQQIMVKQKKFDNFTKYLQVPHHEVLGKTLGVIGAGSIGKQVIKVALALGMNILYYDKNTVSLEGGSVKSAALDELLCRSDFITLHCPLTPETKYLLNSETLKLVKPSAYIINTSRGQLIKETDLINALRNRQIAGAALDVQEQEPPAADNPLFDMENVIITPHIGWQTLESRQRLVEKLTENIASFVNGRPVNTVN